MRPDRTGEHSFSPPPVPTSTAGAIELYPLVRQRWPRDVPAQPLQPLALVGCAAHRRMQAETVHLDAQRLARHGLARPRVARPQHLCPARGPKAIR